MVADWFRFYSDALDEPRLQYAVEQEPSCIAVFVWMLCQCAKKHSEYVEKPSDSLLLGLSSKLNVPPGRIVTAFNTLVRINYVEEEDDQYRVRRWADLQSEYAQRKMNRLQKDSKSKMESCTPKLESKNGVYPKSKNLNKNPTCPDTVPTVYGREERRGDKSRVDKTNTSPFRRKKASRIRDYKAKGFDTFWTANPRKESKGAAYDAYLTVLDGPVAPEDLLIGAKTYASAVKADGREMRHIKLAATWLNGGCWEDQYSAQGNQRRSRYDEE